MPDPRRHRLKTALGIVVSVAVACLAGYVLYRTFQRISLAGVLLNGVSDVATNLDGSIDALATFTNVWGGVATYYDELFQIQGGYYGAFIGVASNQWSTLAPYISRRVDDNPVESKRVELFRLPQADNQPKVRLRFAHAGDDSWYFGVDNVGLYSLTPQSLAINSIVRNGDNITISWNGARGVRLQKSTSLSGPNWNDIQSTEGASSYSDSASGNNAYYRLLCRSRAH